MTLIDVHTHMLTLDYIEMLKQYGGDKYDVKKTSAGEPTVHLYGAPFMTLREGMWDYDLRIKNMDKAGVDIAIVSLTCPNVYWGNNAVSLQAAKIVNDSMAEQQVAWPDRIRWFTSLPFLYPDEAIAELRRSMKMGAVGVMVLANIDDHNLTDPRFAPIWQSINDYKLPVLVHPTAPQGIRSLKMDEFGLVPPVGFMFDTTLAISRMILSGFIDRYPDIRIIAGHGGAALPYLAGRLDRCHEMIPACADVIRDKPSSYLQRIYYDTVLYDQRALELCIEVAGSADKVLYGSDYPHNLGDMEGCLARVNSLPEDMASSIRSKNAERIFNL